MSSEEKRQQTGRIQQAISKWEAEAEKSAVRAETQMQTEEPVAEDEPASAFNPRQPKEQGFLKLTYDEDNVNNDENSKNESKPEKNSDNIEDIGIKGESEDEKSNNIVAETEDEDEDFAIQDDDLDYKNHAESEKENYRLEPDEDEQDIDLYQTQETILSSLKIKFTFSLIIAAVLLIFSVAKSINLTLPGIIGGVMNPYVFLIINTALLLVQGVICYQSAVFGLFKLFRLKPDSDTLTSLAFYGSLVGSIFFMANNTTTHPLCVFAAAASVCITFNTLGKIFLVSRVKSNYGMLSEAPEMMTAHKISDENLISYLSRGTGIKNPEIISAVKSKGSCNYLENAYAEMPLDKAARIFVPLLIITAITAACAVVFLFSDIENAFLTFSVICCIGVPATGEMGASLPFWRCCRKLRRRHVVITGNDTVNQLSDVNAVVTDAGLLFPGDSIKLYGIKAFTDNNLDEAILDAASIIVKAQAPLTDTFIKIIDGRTDLLKNVDDMDYIDEMGICGWVESRRVLIGNRSLLRRYGVTTPSRDFEAKCIGEGRDVIYLAVAGVLCCMFIIGYLPDKRTSYALRNMRKLGISLLVKTCDPNINADMIAERYRLDINEIKILSAREQKQTDESDIYENSDGLCFRQSLGSLLSALVSCIRLQGTISVCTVLQMIGAISGVGFMIYIAFTTGIEEIGVTQLLTYQAIWSIPVLLIGLFRKN